VVTPPITVVYAYAIGAPGVPVVEPGCPTGPCWSVWVEIGARVADDTVVDGRVCLENDGLNGFIRVEFKRTYTIWVVVAPPEVVMT
jgi:hypothetical protein